ncbi:hypothetical protein GGS20DRAFT_412709 [Poronia punctata]|nr:hypothetical protein GGS20DRAFT_412709 [Poronia punctata]
MQLLTAILLFFAAGTANSSTFGFPTDLILPNSVFDEGYNLPIKWTWTATEVDLVDGSMGVLELVLLDDFSNDEQYETELISDKVDLLKSPYDWHVTAPSGSGPEQEYSIRMVFDDGQSWAYTKRFSIQSRETRNDDNANNTPLFMTPSPLTSSSSSSSSSSSPIATSTTTTNTGMPEATPAADTSSAPAHGVDIQLTKGDLAGIVVGAIAGIGLVVGLIVLVLFYRRKFRASASKKENNGNEKGIEGDHGAYMKPELDARDSEKKSGDGVKYEKDGVEIEREVHELQGDEFVREVDATTQLPRELDSNTRSELDAVGNFKEPRTE